MARQRRQACKEINATMAGTTGRKKANNYVERRSKFKLINGGGEVNETLLGEIETAA